ncbi:unnamed protein product [Ixodes persulcatus]
MSLIRPGSAFLCVPPLKPAPGVVVVLIFVCVSFTFCSCSAEPRSASSLWTCYFLLDRCTFKNLQHPCLCFGARHHAGSRSVCDFSFLNRCAPHTLDTDAAVMGYMGNRQRSSVWACGYLVMVLLHSGGCGLAYEGKLTETPRRSGGTRNLRDSNFPRG